MLALLVCACATSRSAARAPEVGPTEGGHSGLFHTVVAGETIYALARENGVSEQALLEENLLAGPQDLRAGMELFIPHGENTGGDAPRAPSAPTTTRKKLLPPRPHAETPRLAWPVRGVLYSRFGPRERDFHDGIDIACPEGTPVAAAGAGRVVFAGVQRGYGNIVLLRHSDGLITVYAHNAENGVHEGDDVSAGQVIAHVGRTGQTTGPHLHFEVRESARAKDPLGFLP